MSLAFMPITFTCSSVFVVNRIADMPSNAYEADRDTLEFVEEITRVIVKSLGILVGSSWEHSFDGSVEEHGAVCPWTSTLRYLSWYEGQCLRHPELEGCPERGSRRQHHGESFMKVVSYPNMLYVGEKQGNSRGYIADA